MYIKKIIFFSSIILIFYSVINYFLYFFNNSNQIVKQVNSINKIKNQKYTTIPYIEIPDFNFQRIIINTTDLVGENKTYIGIFNREKEIDKIKHLVLAGHNTKAVFGFLPKINLNNLIYIYYKDKKYTYKIMYTKIISVKDMYILNEKGNYLTLITCTNDDQKRFIVRAIKQKEELM